MFRRKLNRLWRILKAGFCFAIFGIGALIIFLLIFPLINLFCRRNKNNFLRKTIHLSWRFFVSIMSILDLISVKVRNIDELTKSKGQIIVANHPSLIDVVILVSIVPQADCIVKSALANNFFMKGIVKSIYIINSTNVDELFLACKNSLAKGNNLIIFPEGTRTAPNKKSKILRGAAQIAIYSQSNVLPVHIKCTPAGLLKSQKWYEVADQKLEFNLEIKPIIVVDKYLDKDSDKSVRARSLTKNIKELLEIF